MLDRNFRELCLKDSQEAIKSIAQTEQGIPTDIVFLEEDGGGIPEGFTAFVLPPYLKQSWLLSKPQKDV